MTVSNEGYSDNRTPIKCPTCNQMTTYGCMISNCAAKQLARKPQPKPADIHKVEVFDPHNTVNS